MPDESSKKTSAVAYVSDLFSKRALVPSIVRMAGISQLRQIASSTSVFYEAFVIDESGSAGTPAAPGLVSEIVEDEDDEELST